MKKHCLVSNPSYKLPVTHICASPNGNIKGNKPNTYQNLTNFAAVPSFMHSEHKRIIFLERYVVLSEVILAVVTGTLVGKLTPNTVSAESNCSCVQSTYGCKLLGNSSRTLENFTKTLPSLL